MTVYNFPSDAGFTPAGGFDDGPGSLTVGFRFTVLSEYLTPIEVHFYDPVGDQSITGYLFDAHVPTEDSDASGYSLSEGCEKI